MYPTNETLLKTSPAHVARRHAPFTPVAPRPVDLAHVISMAGGLNQNTADAHGVRVHCYCLDQQLEGTSEIELLRRLDALLGRIVRSAQWGSLVIVEAEARKGAIELRVGYSQEASGLQMPLAGIDWIDEIWSFETATMDDRPH